MISLKKKQSGFTIVELLIVIVVIGILATLVIVTFSGVQQKARDTKRETDVKALASQLEVYYANNGSYPAIAQLQDNTWVQANLKGLDVAGLVAPNGSGTNTISATASTTTYQYVATPSGCTTANKDCTGFTITANREASGASPIVKANLSN
ncbi:MAG: type II secretion system protein [Candidatus Saccharimonadales bacterium]